MADRLYGADLAAFITAFGEAAFIYEADGEGTPVVTTRQGRQLLVPTPAGTVGDPVITLKVFTDKVDGTQLTELLDDEGAEASVLTVSAAWLTLGQILQFTVIDGPAGDVWLTTNESTGPWARAMPFTAEIFARLAAAEAPKATTDLTDVSATPPTDGQYRKYVSGTGEWTPATPPGGASQLGELSDVELTGTPATGTTLVRGADGKYRPGAAGPGIEGAPDDWPTESPWPAPQHSHPSTDVTDATPVGRAVLTSTDQATARAAIGAGTGNGTSNLAIGTTEGTAAAGNHGHTEYYRKEDVDLGFQKAIRVLYADQSDADIPIGQLYFRRAGDEPDPVDVPTLVAFDLNRTTITGTTATGDVPAGVAAGDMLLAICVGEAPTGDPTFTWPAGWTTLAAVQRCGSMHWQAAAIDYTSETDVEVTFSGNYAGTSMMVILVRGADDVANWIAGAAKRRADITPSTTFNNEAPGLIAPANSLLLAMSMERTSAAPDVPSSITGTPTPVEWEYEAQGTTPALTTFWIGSVEIASDQTTGVVTVVYPQTQSANGGAMQIAIPGAPA